MDFEEETKFPYCGIGILCFLKDSNKILLTRRIKDNNVISVPGGWLEFFETFQECASRELWEEANLSVSPTEFKEVTTLNCYNGQSGYHNVAVFMACEVSQTQVESLKNNEPDKHQDWFWADLANLQENIEDVFYPNQLFFKKYNFEEKEQFLAI